MHWFRLFTIGLRMRFTHAVSLLTVPNRPLPSSSWRASRVDASQALRTE